MTTSSPSAPELVEPAPPTLPRRSPTVEQLRAVCQPESVLGRVNAEHWAGRLYMRAVSIHVTRVIVTRTRLSADAVTWLFIASGLLAAAVLTLPGWWPALAALLLVQAQLLLDCSDGEVARWRGTSSPLGVYLDRIGHYTTEAALPAALGVRAAGGWDSLDGWTSWGLLAGLLTLVVKSETDLVHTARAHARLPLLEDRGVHHAGRRTRSLRQLVRLVPFNRLLLAVELSFVVLLVSTVDAVRGDLAGTQALVALLVPVALVVAAGHLWSIVASDRLR